MGHNFVQVGEEYDNGVIYTGCNSAPSAYSIKWKEWLTEPEKPIVEQMAESVVQDYAWFDLSKGAYKIDFKSKGIYSRWSIRLSVSGFDLDGGFIATLDGKQLPWTSPKHFDRTFSKVILFHVVGWRNRAGCWTPSAGVYTGVPTD